MNNIFDGVFDELGLDKGDPFLRQYLRARAKDPKDATADDARAIIRWELMKLSNGMAHYVHLLRARDVRRAARH